MASSSSIHLILLCLLAFTSSSSAFNVTSLLGPLPQFSTFSNYLTQVGLVSIIADLKNVTILAVPNSKMASISGKSRDQIRRIMAMHIIPEYYDLETLIKKTLPNGTASLRTVYVLTGLARGNDGILRVTQRERSNSHRFTFSSAVDLPRANRNNINLIQSVTVPSHNISVFLVSDLITASPPPPSDVAAGDRLGGARISMSSKVVVKRDQEKQTTEEGILPKTSLDVLLVPTEDASPAKAPAKGGSSSSSSSPKKSPSKAPSSPSSNSTSKGKSPSSAPSSDSSAPAPTKKKSDSPLPAPTKPSPASNPPNEPKAKASEPSPSESSENAPPPSKSGNTSSPPPSESPASTGTSTSAPPSGNSPTKSSPPAPASESTSAESPSGEAPSAEAPKSGADPMMGNKVWVMVTAMALWALAA